MVPMGIVDMPRVAYSLIRWSDPHQREGHSKERQEDFAPEWCRRNNARLDDSMGMVLDGQSAFRGHHRRQSRRKIRPLADFLEAIRTGRVSKGSILIMENIDRLSREDIDEAWELFRGILKAGVDVVTQTPERHYTPESLKDLFAIMEVKFSMYRAHEESLMKSKRVRAAWQSKKRAAASRKEPVSSSCPRWIELREGKYRLIPDRARIVRRIFKEARSGMGAYSIAKRLRKEGVPCFGRKQKWIAEYIRAILKRRATYGAYTPGERDQETGLYRQTGEVIEDYYPPVVNRDDWEEAQGAMRSRYRASGRTSEDEANLFTGLVHEARSRERMHKMPQRVGQFVYEYLIARRSETCARVPYLPLRDGIVRMIGDLKPEDVLEADEAMESRLQRLSDVTNELESLNDRLKMLEEQQNDPDTPKELVPSVQRGIVDVGKRITLRSDELRQLEDAVRTNRTKNLGACQSALALLDSPDRRRKAKMRLRQLVESIWVLVQPINRKRRILHVQIYLRGGRMVYKPILPPNPQPGLRVWNCGNCDFREGDIGDEAGDALGAHLVG